MLPVSKGTLGADVIRGLVEAKRLFQLRQLKPHVGRELLSATAGRRGAHLVEHQVGKAHRGDSSESGRRRLVLLIQSGRIEEVYFSEDAGGGVKLIHFGGVKLIRPFVQWYGFQV
jgi:hypothetical protein